MKYKEDMMEDAAECPGITPNNLDLDVSPTCLEEKERGLLGCLWSVW